jgi:hypothetical protein
MRITKILISVVMCFGMITIVQSQTVDSIKAEQAGNLIKINYKILNSNTYQVFRVTVSATINGGLESRLKSLSGDFGDNVIGGKSEYLVLWDVLKDVDEVRSVDFSIKAEKVKDDSPRTTSSKIESFKNKRIYIIPSMGQGHGTYYGLRFAYMGSWGVSAKMLFGKEEREWESGGEDVSHLSFDISKRIISKGVFQMHLIAGVNYGKLLVYNGSGAGYFDKFATYEAGAVFGIGSVSVSFAITPYNPTQSLPFWRKDFGNFGIGMRF